MSGGHRLPLTGPVDATPVDATPVDARPVDAPSGEAEVWRVLEQIEDPELPLAITDLGLVREVRRDGGRVTVRLVPTYSACPAIEVIRRTVRERVAALPGVEEVTVDLTFDEPWTLARLSARGREQLRRYGLSVPRRTFREPATCPFCGSTDVVLETPFGPTLCRAIAYCRACRNPVERFKPPAD